jgi:hypothetical protein
MKYHPPTRVTYSNRDVSDLPRAELEELVMDMHRQLDEKALQITEGNGRVRRAGTRGTAAEGALQDKCLDYIIPPAAVRPRNGLTYIGVPYTVTPEEPPPHQLEEGQEFKIRSDPKASGSYNPWEGATRRVVGLRQKIGDLQQFIADTDADTLSLERELERLRALLENRDVPTNQPFTHQKPIPKFKEKKKTITLKSCVKYCEELLKREKEPKSYDELLCVYYLLTRDDVHALELFGVLLAPDFGPADLENLDDLLKDRDAQVSILREQFRHLLARHEPLRDAFQDLKKRMPDHLVDNEEVVESLQKQIDELLKQIEGIPALEADIVALRETRDRLRDEKEQLFRAGGVAAAEVDADGRNRLAEISAEKAGVEQEKRQLEEVDTRIRERYKTIVEELRRMKEDEVELKRMLEDRENRTREMHDRMTKLEQADIRTARQVREVFRFCHDAQPDDLARERSARSDEVVRMGKDLKELKRTCTRLKASYQARVQQIKSREEQWRRLNAGVVRQNPDAVDI